MKRIISIVAAAAMLFGTASCQRESIPGKEGDSKVTFSVVVPDDAVTRAEMSDGSTVDELVYEVYVGGDVMYEGTVEPSATLTSTGSRQFELELNLVKGMTYDLLFWAQKKGTGYYVTGDLRNVSANYETGKKMANDENRDAFCGAKTGYTVTGVTTSETVNLYRPFAQINFGSAPGDWEKVQPFIVNNGLKSQVTVKNVPTSYNVYSGDVLNTSADITFDYALSPASEDDYTNDYIVYNQQNYGWVAMNYIFAPKNGSTISSVKAAFVHDKNDANSPLTKEILNVRFKQNYKTNILGDIFTGGNRFTVVINSGFANEPIEEYPDYVIK